MSSPAVALKNVSGHVKKMAQTRAVIKKPHLTLVENKDRMFATFADALPVMTTLKASELRQLPVLADGECIDLADSQKALDVIHHIKEIFRLRGFGCYVLHNYVWIVPFIHEGVRIPDFERAKKSLPDLKGDFLKKVFPTGSASQVPPTVNVVVMSSLQETSVSESAVKPAVPANKAKSPIPRILLTLLGGFVVGALVYAAKEMMNAR